MVVLNDLDRFHLALDVVDRVPRLSNLRAYVRDYVQNKLVDHKNYIHKYGDDMPEIKEWKWTYS